MLSPQRRRLSLKTIKGTTWEVELDRASTIFHVFCMELTFGGDFNHLRSDGVFPLLSPLIFLPQGHFHLMHCKALKTFGLRFFHRDA